MWRTTTPPGEKQNALSSALRACRSSFITFGLFSLVINILMLTMPLYMLQVYDRVLSTGRLETLLLLTVMAVSALAILGFLDALRSMVMARVGRWLNQRLAPIFLASGVRARILGDDAGAQPLRDLTVVEKFISGSGMSFLFDAPTMPLFLGLIWLMHPYLGMLALGAAVVLFLLSLINDRMTRKAMLEGNVAQIRATLQAETTIRNAEVVQSMGMLPTMIGRWQVANARTLDANQKAAERSGAIVACTKALRMMVQMGVLGLGAVLVIKGLMSPGGMIACSILTSRSLAPVEQAVNGWKSFTGAMIAYRRLKLRLSAVPVEASRTQLPHPTGHLTFNDVSYYPPGSPRPVLRQVSIAVHPGEVLTVVGPSAAGKSTLCRLMVGIYQPSSGKVCLDGADLSLWDPQQLGPSIGYLPQDVELFAGTVRDNIARMTECDDAGVIDAAVLAHAHEMILRLPDGYDTPIGEAGSRLSGGQRQRIGLARAVYGSPSLIVLDEPNANLDQAGEAALAGAILELKGRGAAIVIIGHRPSSLAHADKILLLREGRAELYGPRDEILQKLRKDSVTRAEPAATTAVPAESPSGAPVPIGVERSLTSAPAAIT